MSELGAIFFAVRTGIAHGVGLSMFLLALGLAPEGLLFLAAVQGAAFLVAHLLLRLRGRLRQRPQLRAQPALNASTTWGWLPGSATSANRIS